MKLHEFIKDMEWSRPDYMKLSFLARAFSQQEGPCPKGASCPKVKTSGETREEICYKCWTDYLKMGDKYVH